MDISRLIPLAFKAMQHREDFDRIMQLAAPTIAEAQKAWPELYPLVRDLAVDLFPELQKQIGGDSSIATFDVTWLQTSLNSMGEKLKVTGAYDEETHAAVRRFQTTHKLDPDGWAGIKTVLMIGAQLNMPAK